MTTETPEDKANDVEDTPPADDAAPPNKDPRGGRKGRPRSYLPLAFRPAGRQHRIPIDPRRFNLKPGTLVVVETDRGLERRYQIADNIFRRIMDKRRQLPAVRKVRAQIGHNLLHQQGVLGDRKRMVARGLPVPARDAGKPVGDVLKFDVER